MANVLAIRFSAMLLAMVSQGSCSGASGRDTEQHLSLERGSPSHVKTEQPLTVDVLVNSESTRMLQEYYSSAAATPHQREQELFEHRRLPRHFVMRHRKSSPMFFLQAALLAIVIFVLMFAYSQTHETVQEHTGLKFAHVCCIVYATLSITIDLSIKNAAESYGGHFPMNPACSVVVVEYSKLVVSAGLFAMHVQSSRSSGREITMPRLKDVAWLSVPAFIYAVNNLLVFQAIKSTPLSTFGVVRETMLIWTAVIWMATFKQPISTTRWLAICGIFFGCSVNQVPKMLSEGADAGVSWSVLLALSNAAGGVLNEYAMKQRAQLDINLQNFILYGLCGSMVLIGIAVFEPLYVQSSSHFFKGFVPECWQVIILQVFTGLAVSRILKYMEAVTKTIVAAIRGPGVIFIGAIMFHVTLGISEAFATLIVCVACYAYLSQGPLPKPAPRSEPSEKDSLVVSSGTAKV